jgi:hypothetical protein
MTSSSQKAYTIGKLARQNLSEFQQLMFYMKAFDIFTQGKISNYQIDEIRRTYECLERTNRNGSK